jgi:hypothetical protein
MYEHRKQPLASPAKFYARLINNIMLALFVMAVCMVIGVLGYHYTEDIPWLDSVHQSAMILGGMGPIVTEFHTNAGKIFSSAYALFCGVVFITNVGIILAPVAHRLFHRLHVED